jgi:glycosyltransferase involved in cell wall biosynthesis
MVTLPKISIVTVSYNQGQYLEQTIRSVLDQNYPNLEYIIIDGGSTDNSVEIIKKYESQLAYWVSEKDSGQSEAINKGRAKCTGDIFNWLCSDDYLEDGALLKIGEAFVSELQPDIVYGKVREFNDEGTRDEIKKGTRIEPTVYKSIVRTFITQPVTFWKRDMFNEIGLDDRMHWFMDYEMWVKYLYKYGQNKVMYIDSLLAHYRFHETSKSQMEADYTQTKKSSKYKIDMNSIHNSVAHKIGYTRFYDIIPTLSTELVKNYTMNLNLTGKESIARQALNYYVFDNAVRYYWANDFTYAAQLFSKVDVNELEHTDQLIQKNLSFRSNYAPLLKLLRPVKRLFTK